LLQLLNKDIQSDVIKFGHHGLKTASDEKFIKKVNPSYAVISANDKDGRGKTYGHPDRET